MGPRAASDAQIGIDEAVKDFGTLHAAGWRPGLPRPYTAAWVSEVAWRVSL